MGAKIYVGNLPFNITEKEFSDLFSSYGEISEAVIIKDKYSGRSKGFGFVTFVNDADADKAVAELNDYELKERKLVVNEARPKKEF